MRVDEHGNRSWACECGQEIIELHWTAGYWRPPSAEELRRRPGLCGVIPIKGESCGCGREIEKVEKGEEEMQKKTLMWAARQKAARGEITAEHLAAIDAGAMTLDEAVAIATADREAREWAAAKKYTIYTDRYQDGRQAFVEVVAGKLTTARERAREIAEGLPKTTAVLLRDGERDEAGKVRLNITRRILGTVSREKLRQAEGDAEPGPAEAAALDESRMELQAPKSAGRLQAEPEPEPAESLALFDDAAFAGLAGQPALR